MMRFSLGILAVWLISTLVVAQGYILDFEADKCPYFMVQLADEYDTEIICGFLIVSEDREQINGSLELELFVVWIESKHLTDNIPIVILEGGPGGAASASLEDWFNSSLHMEHDIILVDQRGTGLSYPWLNCFELDEIYDIDAIATCRDRLLAEGIRLEAYNSANNAHDIHDLLVKLEIDEANLYGSSYGSRLALTIARDFPERIHAMILDAVYPPHVNTLVDAPYYGHQAFERLFADCAADEQCNSVYPNLRESFFDTIITMNNSPAYIEDFDNGFTIEMTGDDFVNNIYGQLYETEMIPLLPALIDAYSRGEYQYDPLLEAYADDSPVETDMLDYDDDSEGMFFSVECYEEIHFNTEDDIELRSQGLPEHVALALVDISFASIDECAVWTENVSPALENQPVESDIPTLILSGAYDPTTPSEWGIATSEYLPNSWHYIFPDVGHGALDVNTCATAIVLDFLQNPTDQPDDTCISTLNPPQFFIRE